MRSLLVLSLFLGLVSMLPACREETRIEAGDPRLQQDLYGRVLLSGIPFTGILDERHADGSRAESSYRDGRQEGVSRRWHPNGALASLRRYSSGVKTGRHRGFWPNGRRRFDFTLLEGAYHGTYRAWFESGQLYQLLHFDRGREEGRQQSWTETGELFANYLVKDGRRFGLLGTRPCFTVKGGTS